MKGILMLLSFHVITLVSCSQSVDWKEARNWKIYEVINEQVAKKCSSDTLERVRNMPLNDDSIRYFVQQASRLQYTPRVNEPIWMGFYLSSCQLKDGLTRKIFISVYGGFFLDEKTGTYYVLSNSVRDEWLGYLSKKALDLQMRSVK